MAQEDQDKTDPASEYKLQKARERGSVAKSADLTYLAVLFGLTCCVFGMGERISRDMARLAAATLAQASQVQSDPAHALALAGSLTVEVVTMLAMPLAVIAVLAALASFAQVGFHLSAEPLKPDFNRINPAQGLKRLFSMRTFYELFRSSLKVGAVALLVAVGGASIIGELVALPLRQAGTTLHYLIHTTGVVLAALTAAFALLAAADLAYTRWEFSKQMRMSRREVKDEHKQREGDPRIKQRIRQLRMEWFKKGVAMHRVKDSDVVVTNPTHIAVAIAYKRDTMAAPQVLAKGAGQVALRIRELAARHQVMIVENPPLARALYREAEPGSYLPQAHYAAVAKILVWVFAARKKARGA